MKRNIDEYKQNFEHGNNVEINLKIQTNVIEKQQLDKLINALDYFQ